MLVIYPARHGDCTSLERGKLDLRTTYELSFILLAANCNFALRLALSKKQMPDNFGAGGMFLVTRTQGPK